MADMKWSPEDWARLGAKIRSSREAQGFSRRKMAELSGISEKSIQLIEEGRVPSRWPKSLDALEEPLGWPQGSMFRVLERVDIDAELLDNSTVAAGGANYGADGVVVMPDGASQNLHVQRIHDASATVRPTTAWWFQQMDHLDLPDEIRKVLPQVAFFATTSVMHGAPEWLASAYTNTVYMMLDDVHQKRVTERQEKPATKADESDERIAELQAEINRIRAAAQAMEMTLELDHDQVPDLEQTADHREMRDQLQQLNERLDALSSD